MTAAPAVSVIVVSRRRPGPLRRCLLGLMQLDYPACEVIVAADPPGLAVARGFPVRTVAFDLANISAARNAGICAAAGEVVAFIDDDAVPEPQWLCHLARPFADPLVAAAGGFVLGTNGISLQWAGGTVDRLLVPGLLALPDDAPSLHRASPGKAIEIKGVNCAYRRSLLLGMGGFDPELRYYLDETELNLRLAALGAVTAIVPEARVHHLKAPSDLRHGDRTPRDLAMIGASTTITLRRHGATPAEVAHAGNQFASEQEARLAGLVAARRLTRAEADRLMATLRSGLAEGAARALAALAPLRPETAAFMPLPARTAGTVVLAGRPWQRARLSREAARRAAAGQVVRLFLFGPTALFHRRRFTDEGFWLHTGGLFGKSDRADPWFRFWRFSARLRRESARFSTGYGNS